ncbi:MAG TPA: 30S ribosome-binding factor RbfA [Clostridiales bacterium]|jgi:ribosome-binding factor A|nr:30S ribosome-binding factor RbfA [Clostridiales bacterium]
MAVKRLDRINEEAKKQLSEIIREMKDPRISDMTTIVSVSITNDYKIAKVRVSVYDKDDKVRSSTVEALNHAAGFIARELGNRMQIRRLPQITFSLDSSIEYSVHIGEILNRLNIQKDDETKQEE